MIGNIKFILFYPIMIIGRVFNKNFLEKYFWTHREIEEIKKEAQKIEEKLNYGKQYDSSFYIQ